MTTKSEAMSAARLIAPRFGPRSIRMTSAPCCLPAFCTSRQKADVMRKARGSPPRHFGQTSERSSSNVDSSHIAED